MQYLLKIRLKEESERRDGIPGIAPKMFSFFTDAKNNAAVRKAYDIMQQQYVLRDADRIPFKKALESLIKIKALLERNPAWRTGTPIKKKDDREDR